MGVPMIPEVTDPCRSITLHLGLSCMAMMFWPNRLEGLYCLCHASKQFERMVCSLLLLCQPCSEPNSSKAGGAEPEQIRVCPANGREDEMRKRMRRRMSPFSSSADRGTNRSSGDFKKGSIGPPPSYDGSREVGIFEEYRVRAKCCSQPTQKLEPEVPE